MTDSIPGGPPPAASAPPPPPPPGSTPLARSPTDRYIAGVCGGLGAHFGVAPLVFRLGFVALTFAGGAGIILYVAAWALLPEAGAGRHGGWRGPALGDRNVMRLVVYALLLFAALILGASVLHVAADGVIVGLGLLGIGVVLLMQERERSTPGVPIAPFAAPPAAYAAGGFSTPAATEPVATWEPQAPRPRSVLGLVTVAAALLAVGVVALLDTTGVAGLSLATCLAIALIVVGVGLVAGAWFGRSAC